MGLALHMPSYAESIIWNLIKVIADAGNDVEKGDHSSISGGTASYYNHCGNQSGGSSDNWT